MGSGGLRLPCGCCDCGRASRPDGGREASLGQHRPAVVRGRVLADPSGTVGQPASVEIVGVRHTMADDASRGRRGQSLTLPACAGAVVVVSCLALVGCTSSASVSGPTASTALSGSSASTGTTASTTLGRGSGARECSASSLHLRPSQVVRLHGQLIPGYAVTNRGAKACWVGGYPHVLLRDPHGRSLRVSVLDGGGYFEERATAAKHFVLPPGGSIGFNIQLRGAGGHCWRASEVGIEDPPRAGMISASVTADSRPLRGCGRTVRVAAFYAPVF